MKILILSKRQYTNLDLIDDKFGRIRELPVALAQLGHELTGICLSYRLKKEGVFIDKKGDIQVRWCSLNIKRLLPFGANSYLNVLDNIHKEKKPDIIWASSDALHIILGAWIAKRYDVPLIADLYDNYESFPATRLPGLTRLFRRLLKSADGITCVSGPLADYVRKTTTFSGPIKVIENAVPMGVFYPMDKLDCRRQLGLPDKGFFIGTAGAISRSRNIDVLLHAFQILAEREPDVHLVLAGPRDKGLTLPKNNRLHYLGVLAPNKIPAFLSTLDIQVICNRNSAFGRYCFPQKFYEAVACKIPLVAAAVGAMRETLKDNPGLLFEPESPVHLTSALQQQIQNPSSLLLEEATWDMRGKKLEQFIIDIVSVYNM